MKFKILDLNKETINNRIYPTKVVEEAINSPIIQELLQCGGIPIEDKRDINLKELDTININNVIGFAKKLYIEDDSLYVEATNLIEGKNLVDISFYASGEIHFDDNNLIQTYMEIDKSVGEQE